LEVVVETTHGILIKAGVDVDAALALVEWIVGIDVG
jgi:hypothetical protein